MSNPLGPIDIHCDAPPYPVVRAGHRIGLRSPEDVRWWRMSHFLEETAGRAAGLPAWKALLGLGGGAKSGCTCGQELPRMERYTFTFLTGRQSSYLIGQCVRCRTVF